MYLSTHREWTTKEYEILILRIHDITLHCDDKYSFSRTPNNVNLINYLSLVVFTFKSHS